MDTYTASNGIRINVAADLSGEKYLTGTRLSGGGCPDVYPAQTHATASEDGMTALREFFRAEEDERLGRWRWSENPDYVVYRWAADPPRRNVRGVTVLSETIPRGYTVWEDNVDTLYGTSVNEEARKAARDAARAYFDAHPEKRPWHDAKAGEVWAVTVDGREFAAKVNTDSGFPRFIALDHDLTYGPRAGFTAGRRIWPEEGPS